MYGYAYPEVGSVSFVPLVMTSTYQAEVAHTAQLRTVVEQVLRRDAMAPPLQVVQVRAGADAGGERVCAVPCRAAARCPAGHGAVAAAARGVVALCACAEQVCGARPARRAGRDAPPVRCRAAQRGQGARRRGRRVRAGPQPPARRARRAQRAPQARDRRPVPRGWRVGLCRDERAAGVPRAERRAAAARDDAGGRARVCHVRSTASRSPRLALADAHGLAIRRLQAPAMAHVTDTLPPGPPLPPAHPSPSLLAKLHLHAAALYRQAHALVAPPPPASPAAAAQHKLHRTFQALQREGRDTLHAWLAYAEREARVHRSLAYKWLGIEAGEHTQQVGVAVAYLSLALETWEPLLPSKLKDKLRAPPALRPRLDTDDQRLALEHASVQRWRSAYQKMNDSVRRRAYPGRVPARAAARRGAAVHAGRTRRARAQGVRATPRVWRHGPTTGAHLCRRRCVLLSRGRATARARSRSQRRARARSLAHAPPLGGHRKAHGCPSSFLVKMAALLRRLKKRSYQYMLRHAD